MLVLYESLCPDSVGFMQRQLAPNYNDFKDVIDITLVPFGKSHVSLKFNQNPRYILSNRLSCLVN